MGIHWISFRDFFYFSNHGIIVHFIGQLVVLVQFVREVRLERVR